MENQTDQQNKEEQSDDDGSDDGYDVDWDQMTKMDEIMLTWLEVEQMSSIDWMEDETTNEISEKIDRSKQIEWSPTLEELEDPLNLP